MTTSGTNSSGSSSTEILQMWLLKFRWRHTYSAWGTATIVNLVEEKAWKEIDNLFMQLTQFNPQKADPFCVASLPCQVQVLMGAIYAQPEGDDCVRWNTDWMNRVCKWIQRDFGTMGFHPDKQVSNGPTMVQRANEWYVLGQGIISMLKLLIDAYPHTTNTNISNTTTSSSAPAASTFQFDEWQYQQWQQQQQELFRQYNPCTNKSSTHSWQEKTSTSSNSFSLPTDSTSTSSNGTKEAKEALSELSKMKHPTVATGPIEEAYADTGVEGKVRMRCVKRRLIGEEPVVYRLTIRKPNGPLRDIETCLLETLDQEPNVWHARTNFLTANSRSRNDKNGDDVDSSNSDNKSMAAEFLSAMEDCRDESEHKSYTATTRINSVKLLEFCRRKLDDICDYSMQFPVPTDTADIDGVVHCVNDNSNSNFCNPDGSKLRVPQLLIKRATNDKSWLFQLKK